MKKLLAVILALSMLLSLSCVFASAQSGLQFLAAGDFHYQPAPDSLPNYNSDPVYFYSLKLGGMLPESGAIIDAFLDNAKNDSSEYVLITGDMVETPIPTHHADIIAKLTAFERETGKQIFVINGNHDFSISYTKEQFKSDYADFGYNQALTVDDNTCSYTVDLDDEYRLIAIDSITIGNKDDYQMVIDSELKSWILKQGEQAKKDNKALIALTHCPVLDHVPLLSSFLNGYSLSYDKQLLNDLSQAGIKTVISGHFHITDISKDVTPQNDVIYDILSGSLVTADCPYKKITVNNDNLSVTTLHITSIDVSEISHLYTEQQLALITQDFQQYSKNFYKTGIKHFVKNYFTLNSLSEKFSVEKGSDSYKAIESLVESFNLFYDLPFYSDNPDEVTVSTLAKEKGLTLPKSDYNCFSDVVSDAMYQVTTGDENFGIGTVEYNTLLVATQTLVLTAAEELDSDIIAATVTDFAAKLNLSIPNDLIKSLLANKDEALKNIVKLFFTFVVDNFLVDEAPQDNSVSIKNPYTVKQNAFLNFFESFIRFFNKFIRFVRSLYINSL